MPAEKQSGSYDNGVRDADIENLHEWMKKLDDKVTTLLERTARLEVKAAIFGGMGGIMAGQIPVLFHWFGGK